MTVTTTPVQISSSQLIQNLGPDVLYIGNSSVSASTGVRIDSGKSIAFNYSNSSIYAVSAGTSDVRTVNAGTGVFGATASA